MAYYDTPIDPSIDFDAREAQLVQQKARIEALRKIAGQPIESPGEVGGFTSAVTGTRIAGQQLRTPTAALLTPTLGQVGADLGDMSAIANRRSLSADEQAGYEKWIAAQPQATTGAIVTNPTNNLVEATTGATVQPTRNEILQHAALGNKNPLSRAVAAKLVEDQLIAAPTREAAAAVTAANTSWDRQYKAAQQAELARHHTAQEQQGGKGQFQDSGLVDKASGAKIMANYQTLETGRLNADGSVTVTGRLPPGTQAPGGVAGGTGTAGGTAVRPPVQIDAGTRNKINDNATNITTLQDLSSRYDPKLHSGVKATALNSSPLANALGKSGLVGEDAANSAAYWSDVQAYANQQLRSMSGTAVTESEMGRFKQSMPGPSSKPEIVKDWFARSEKLATVIAAREQALADKGARLDTNRLVVVGPDGNDVPGTESPFPRVEVRGTSKSNMVAPPSNPGAAPAAAVPSRVAPAQQSARDGEAGMVLQNELSKARQRAQEIPVEMAAEKNPQKLLALQAEMSRNEQDIAGLQREIGRLPGSTMPKTNALPRSNPPAAAPPKTIRFQDLP